MKQSKMEQARQLFANGDERGALRIVRNFTLVFNSPEIRLLQIAYESMNGNAKFYQSLGINTDNAQREAREILRAKLAA